MRAYLSSMQQNVFTYNGAGAFAPTIAIDIRTVSGKVVFTHTSEKNNLKETIELFLHDNQGAILENVDLSNLDLSGVDLNNTVFRDSNFNNSVFYNSEICNSRFYGSTFNGCAFCRTKIYESEFQNAEFYGARFYNLEFTSGLFTNDVLKWFRENNQLAAFDSYKADMWMKLITINDGLPALKEALLTGNVNGSSYGGVNSDFCGTLARNRGVNANEIPGINADVSSPVEQWFLLISPGMTPVNSEAVKITVQWIEELERILTAS